MKYSQNDIVPVRAKVRFSTLIVLPDSEDILDFTTGDKDFWIVNGVHNLCFIHPAQAGISTDLNLITASGHVYSFLLTEISNEPNTQPDLKIFIEPKDQSSVGGQGFFQNYVPANEAEAYQEGNANDPRAGGRPGSGGAGAGQGADREIPVRVSRKAPLRLPD